MPTTANTVPNASHTERKRILTAIGWLLLAAPVLTLVLAAVHTSVNIPIADDYEAIGTFLNGYLAAHGALGHLDWILFSEHVQYKLMFLHVIVVLQYRILGHINFRFLALLGDVAAPATVLLYWCFLARQNRPLQQRIWLVLAPWYLFLSIRYYETINWAMSGLQNLAVIPFSLAAVFFFTGNERRSAVWGTVFLVLAIATSGAGFFLIPAVIVTLLWMRRFRVAIVAAVASLAMAAIYFVQYRTFDPAAGLPPVPHYTLPLFVLAFLGSILESIRNQILLGAILLVVFIVLLFRRWPQRSPATFGAALFCIIAALGVAEARYRLNLPAASAGRYRMYCLVLIAMEYLAVLQLFVPANLKLRSRWGAAVSVFTLAAICYGVNSQEQAYRNLHVRQRQLITHFILWERDPECLILIPDEGINEPTRLRLQLNMQRNLANGRYLAPFHASDPLPLPAPTPGGADQPCPAGERIPYDVYSHAL